MATKKKVTRRVYIGPRLSGHRLLPFTVFMNGLPDVAKEIIAANPWFDKLFVGTDEMQVKIAELKKTGSPLNIYYNRAKGV